MTNYLKNNIYHIYDTSNTAFGADPLAHFAMGDALIRLVGNAEAPAALHFWPMEKLVILGMMDTRLPHLEDGLRYLRNVPTDIVVRNAGGLAVVADEGILNFSLVLPETEKAKLTIHDGYVLMNELVEQAFSDSEQVIEAFEISNSYCPGDFDLSINGKKFAGIAQRRFKNGVAIMIYMSVNGKQEQRGEMIRRFYEESLQGEETRWHFPAVDPGSMANLAELLDKPLTVADVKARILSVFTKYGNTLLPGAFNQRLMEEYEKAYIKMKNRN
ncbi:MAG: lipoate--protein ligase family protein, partial [Trichococcus flocculiformis]